VTLGEHKWFELQCTFHFVNCGRPKHCGCFLQRGMAQLPDLHVSDSSEAMLSGRKPPFRLLVRAVATDGRKVNIRHAVSEGFVVRPLFHLGASYKHWCFVLLPRAGPSSALPDDASEMYSGECVHVKPSCASCVKGGNSANKNCRQGGDPQCG
jgi:hypothetical protein